MRKYIVKLEKFEKTKQRVELDRLLRCSGRQDTEKITLYDNILSTFTKYMWEYGSLNIKIKTKDIEPQVYKVMDYNIEIIN